MNAIRTLIVDDEELARERLRGLLKPFSFVEIVGEAEDGESAIEQIGRLHPDLVFLDIQMPGCTGIEVAASLPSGVPMVVFCTAYDEYAIEAFEVRAVDYLLKPVSRTRLVKALDRLRLGQFRAAQVEQALTQSLPRRFLGKRGGRYKVIPVEEVLCFISEGGLTRLWTVEQYYWMEPSLSDLESRLDESRFIRISRQALVNLEHVAEVVPLVGGYGQIKVTGGQVLEVSRRKLKLLLEKLGGENR